jgi:nucleoside-diphosphate-sugar epimerase
VLNACVINGIKDVIVTGTNAVYGEEHSTAIKNERSPYNSHYRYFLDRIFPCKLNYYRDTKCIAAQKAIDFSKREGINLTILDPVWVYGENGRDTVFLQYIKSAGQGVSLSPGSRKNKFHVVYAVDVAQAYYWPITNGSKEYSELLSETMCVSTWITYSLYSANTQE